MIKYVLTACANQKNSVNLQSETALRVKIHSKLPRTFFFFFIHPWHIACSCLDCPIASHQFLGPLATYLWHSPRMRVYPKSCQESVSHGKCLICSISTSVSMISMMIINIYIACIRDIACRRTHPPLLLAVKNGIIKLQIHTNRGHFIFLGGTTVSHRSTLLFSISVYCSIKCLIEYNKFSPTVLSLAMSQNGCDATLRNNLRK